MKGVVFRQISELVLHKFCSPSTNPQTWWILQELTKSWRTEHLVLATVKGKSTVVFSRTARARCQYWQVNEATEIQVNGILQTSVVS